MSSESHCRACGGRAGAHQEVLIRGRPAALHCCPACGTFQFPDPDWLRDAYADPIAEIDTGLPARSLALAAVTEAVMRAEGVGDRPTLDFGGGYGLLTRLLRDRGIDARHHDPFARNLFAHEHEAGPDGDYGCCTLVEVVEHLLDPHGTVERLGRSSDLLLISTVLVPPGMDDLSGWWYLIPELGQHITFLTAAGLVELARRNGFVVTSDGISLHLLHRAPVRRLTRAVITRSRLRSPAARLLREHDRGWAGLPGRLLRSGGPAQLPCT